MRDLKPFADQVRSRFPRLRMLGIGGVGRQWWTVLAMAAPQWPFVKVQVIPWKDSFYGTSMRRKAGFSLDACIEHYDVSKYGTRKGCCLPEGPLWHRNLSIEK